MLLQLTATLNQLVGSTLCPIVKSQLRAAHEKEAVSAHI